jgi:hypothetical protein
MCLFNRKMLAIATRNLIGWPRELAYMATTAPPKVHTNTIAPTAKELIMVAA